jgi:hypothetical protein
MPASARHIRLIMTRLPAETREWREMLNFPGAAMRTKEAD